MRLTASDNEILRVCIELLIVRLFPVTSNSNGSFLSYLASQVTISSKYQKYFHYINREEKHVSFIEKYV